jgi:hypothetical protein
MARDFGRANRKHVWIDLDSWKHPEIWLHVFKQELYRDFPEEEVKLIVVEEGGFVRDEPLMKVMTRAEFIQEYGIDVPELFNEEA